MPRPVLIDQQQKVESAEQEASKKKMFGANPKTVGVLAAMAKNHVEFVQFCDQWEEGKASIRKKKKRFEELQDGDKVPPDNASTDAWSHRPLTCNNLRAAMVLRAKFFRQERKDAFLSPHILRLDDPQERDATLAAVRALLNSKIQALGKSMTKLKNAKNNSMIPTEFPYAFCFLRQQEASRKLKIIERRLGGPMDKNKRNLKFPELVRGWPDNIDPRLRFEIENEALQKREARQREQERRDATGSGLLGVRDVSDEAELRAAWRATATRLHPDMNPPEEAARCAEKFARAREAYEEACRRRGLTP